MIYSIKCFCHVNKYTDAIIPWSRYFIILSVNSIGASVVEYSFLKPYLKSKNILLSVKNRINRFASVFSIILLKQDNKLIGR